MHGAVHCCSMLSSGCVSSSSRLPLRLSIPTLWKSSFLPDQVPSRSDSLAVRSGAMSGAGAKGVTGSPVLSAKAHKGSGGPTPGVQRVTVPAPSHGKETPLHTTRSGGTAAGKAPVNKNASVRPRPAETGSTALGSWQWTSGGKRKKISGVLPAYPAGVTATAQIKMEADGRTQRPCAVGASGAEGECTF